MWTDFISWWQSLWTDATVIGGAIAGFIAALIMFLLGDVLWKTRMERIKRQYELHERQLNEFYAPLYSFYREGFARYDNWLHHNPHTKVSRQPFFADGQNESVLDKLFSEKPGLASQSLLRIWTEFRASESQDERDRHRERMVTKLIKVYHELRRKLKLDYDRKELENGTFGSS